MAANSVKGTRGVKASVPHVIWRFSFVPVGSSFNPGVPKLPQPPPWPPQTTQNDWQPYCQHNNMQLPPIPQSDRRTWDAAGHDDPAIECGECLGRLPPKTCSSYTGHTHEWIRLVTYALLPRKFEFCTRQVHKLLLVTYALPPRTFVLRSNKLERGAHRNLGL